MNFSCDDSIIILDDSVEELTTNKANQPAALSGRNVTQNLASKSNSDNEHTQPKTSDNKTPIPVLTLGNKRARDVDSIPVIEILSDDENISGEVTASEHVEMYTKALHLNKKMRLNFTPTGSVKLPEKSAKKKKKRKKSQRGKHKPLVTMAQTFEHLNICSSKVCDNSKPSDNSKVSGNSKVSANSELSNNSKVSDNSKVSAKSRVGEATKVNDSSKVSDKITASEQSNKIANSSNATATNLEVEVVYSHVRPHPPPPPHALIPIPLLPIPPILNEPPNVGIINFPIINNYYPFNFTHVANGHQPRGTLRPIAIDGSNVAFTHGQNRQFSCKGIKLCIDYFIKRGHSTVKAFVPQFRRNTSNRENVGTEILEKLSKGKQYVVFTPTRKVRNKLIYPYDDRFILEYASQTGAIVVSNDNYRDLLNENMDFRVTIENRLLMYTFADDCFLVPQDPMGRNGPMLEQFLTF